MKRELYPGVARGKAVFAADIWCSFILQTSDKPVWPGILINASQNAFPFSKGIFCFKCSVKIICYFLVKMRPVFAQHIVFMTGIDHIIHLYTFIHTGFYKIYRILLHHTGSCKPWINNSFPFNLSTWLIRSVAAYPSGFSCGVSIYRSPYMIS